MNRATHLSPRVDAEGQRSDLRPLISVVIVVFNALQALQAVLASVRPFRNRDVEVIVIDGGSTDGTVEFLQERKDEVDFWLSEPDRGIYDAMNKAIAKARGTFLLHLNAGDSLLHMPERELRQAERDGIDVAAFRVALGAAHQFRPSAGFALRFTNTLHHQGTFFRRETFPGYAGRYRIFADFDANQKLARSGARMRMHSPVVAHHQTDGVSNRDSPDARAEHFAVIRENYGRAALPMAWMVAKWRGLKRRMGLSV